MREQMSELPTLWHIPVSHYSEKARWALAYKGVEHVRRSPPPGAHMALALWLTRGSSYTFPVLSVDRRNIDDSTAIIAELERRDPEAPLYPEDPEDPEDPEEPSPLVGNHIDAETSSTTFGFAVK